ncbi:MAG TPA: DUF4279 domain-containing protein [Hyphomonadaceae bacterium]|nr:DUF4279 domain-containing protein [Hyphomonadaceae bacterium]
MALARSAFVIPYAVGLQFWHPQRSPDEVTAALGLDPVRCWNKGAARSRPDGLPLSGRHEDNYWRIEFRVEGDGDIALRDAIGAELDKLGSAKAFLNAYTTERGRILMTIYWRLKESVGDDSLPHSFLARLADFRLDLEIAQLRSDEEGNE